MTVGAGWYRLAPFYAGIGTDRIDFIPAGAVPYRQVRGKVAATNTPRIVVAIRGAKPVLEVPADGEGTRSQAFTLGLWRV